MTAYERTVVVLIVVGAVAAACLAALGVWDLLLIHRDQLAGNSASRAIYNTASAHPVWVFILGAALGVLVGHFGWPQRVR